MASAVAVGGMSQREIAAALGVSKDTVNRDLAGVSDETAEQEAPRSEPEPVSNETPVEPDEDTLAGELIAVESSDSDWSILDARHVLCEVLTGG